MEHKIAKSFGVIPLFRDIKGYRILIIQNSRSGSWGLPKGTPEDNETPIRTAIRELQEETGIEEKDIQIQKDPVFLEQYSFTHTQDEIVYDKTNTYYIGFVDTMTVGEDLDEISVAEWVSLEEAKEKLTHKEIIRVVEELETYLNTKPN
jgi:8-oxo-dGTP pyrophosphatase MutT (NUDIX family)